MRRYHEFLRVKDLSFCMEDYNSKLINVNRQVRIIQPNGEITGISKGINSCGELIVGKSDGEEMTVLGGEVSVRGLYGYV